MQHDERILEGLVTTLDPDGATHVAPMGPFVDAEFSALRLRPFQTSRTFANLKRTRQGVFHVTDDVLLLARAAVGSLDPLPEVAECEAVEGRILVDACRWYAFQVTEIEDSSQRSEMQAQVVDQGRLRDFLGFNRAKHAVVEAAILATRIGLLPAEQILEELERLAVPVKKTAGRQEREAFRFLLNHVNTALTDAQTISQKPTHPS